MIYDRIVFRNAWVDLDLQLNTRISFVGGDSGIGKTYLFSILDTLSMYDEYQNIALVNYKCKDVLGTLKSYHNKLVVIDNADVILGAEARNLINLSTDNQYLIFGRNYDGFNVNLRSHLLLDVCDRKMTFREEFCDNASCFSCNVLTCFDKPNNQST